MAISFCVNVIFHYIRACSCEFHVRAFSQCITVMLPLLFGATYFIKKYLLADSDELLN